jgi:predicted site-specific integrase-resolvase
MARTSRKSRPNEIRSGISDASLRIVFDANRTRRRRAMNVGYARTSTSDQTAGLEAQARDLKAAGAERIFGEQVSAASPSG